MSLDINASLSIAQRDSLPLAVLMRDIVERDAGVDRTTQGPEIVNDKLSANLGKPLGNQHNGSKIGPKLRDRGCYDIAKGEPQASQGFPNRMIESGKV